MISDDFLKSVKEGSGIIVIQSNYKRSKDEHFIPILEKWE